MPSKYPLHLSILAVAASCVANVLPKSPITGSATPVADVLDYDRSIQLDAEELAEGGIAEAYRKLLPEVMRYVPEPAQVHESLDPSTPSYSITYGDEVFVIYEPGKEDDSWGRATFALFAIVNDQLTRVRSDYHFYAINGGNDLFGMFLTQADVEAARASLPTRDWPYLPDDQPPWFGQPQ